MNFKLVLLMLIFTLVSACSETSEQAPMSYEGNSTPVNNKDNVLKGYKDKIQKAKDMEKEMLKAADKQRKAING